MNTILNHKNHALALANLEKIMLADPPVGSTEEKTLAELASAIERYEKVHVSIPRPTTAEIARFREEQNF
jgi:hypothetical protein